MSDIKMADRSSLSIPKGATHLLNNCFAKWIDNDRIAVMGNYHGATWSVTNRAMPRNAIELSEISLLREKQNLVEQNKALKAALGDLVKSEWMVSHDWGGDRKAVIDNANKALEQAK